MTKCKDCAYGCPVYKAEDLIDCAKKGGVRLPEDGCGEGKEKKE